MKESFRGARGHGDRPKGSLLYRWKPKRLDIQHDNNGVSLPFCQVLDYDAYHCWGGKRYPNFFSPVPGSLAISCASTSVPKEPSQSYCEKNDNLLLRPGTFCADSEKVMRSKLNGPSTSHSS